MTTVQLISLRCLQAQEINGDEIYITAGDLTLWSTGTLRMSEQLTDDAQIDEVDFVQGRVHSRAGWSPIEDFNAADFVLPVGDGLLVQVKERDLLLGDDVLGQVEIVPGDAPRGEIQQTMTAEGAHYALRFDVTS